MSNIDVTKGGNCMQMASLAMDIMTVAQTATKISRGLGMRACACSHTHLYNLK